MNETVIRQAVEADVSRICELQQKWLGEDNVYGFVPAHSDEIKSRLDEYYLVAETTKGIIGFIAGSVRVSADLAIIPKGSQYLEIDDLYVIPSFRGQGVGSQLVDQLLAHAKERGLDYATLYSAGKDIHAILRFYERHRFQSWYVQMFRKL